MRKRAQVSTGHPTAISKVALLVVGSDVIYIRMLAQSVGP